MKDASETLLALRPVTFRYKSEIDPQGIPQFGLIAEEVEKVNPDLVVRDKEGKANTVRYEQINAMLLNEFLKEHEKVAEQQATIAELKKNAASQTTQIAALTSGLQKVSARISAGQQTRFAQNLEAVADADDQLSGRGFLHDRAHDRRKARDGAAAQIIAVRKAPRQNDRVEAGQRRLFMPDVFRLRTRNAVNGAKAILVAI
jgi:chromosome segregation ATPase